MLLTNSSVVKVEIEHPNRQWYNWLVYRLNHEVLAKLSPAIKGAVYDLGCGERPYESFVTSLGATYTGVDWSNTPHDMVADIFADLNEVLPLEKEIADTVLAFSVMEHLCEPGLFLSESYRILRPGGKVLLQVPFQWQIHEAPYDFYRYTPYGLKYLMEKAGFSNVKIETCGGYFSTATLKFNYFILRLVRGPKLLKSIIKLFLIPVWTFTQLFALVFDRFDNMPEREAQGYWVTADKSE